MFNNKLVSFDLEEARENAMEIIKEKTMSVNAHKDTITSLVLMIGSIKKILTASADYYIKIWGMDGTMLGSLNVNHPLPIYWNNKTD